ncbi:uncharacterized protein LOC130629872 [Hydractinia symbiolongicarpus]|uniref:uncharacterized protein LOC130629872 n=1 Tax=Hydractinia symbiolongicarpus TaxID=13093 RepID=UPI00254CDD8E|nr:uncharacterized protein LOC130629872 [Hydractinia symbiolongicarpus]
MMLHASGKRKVKEEIDAKTYLEERLAVIDVHAQDRKTSRKIVADVLDEIMKCFGEDTIFSKVIRKSGSYATKTKIKAADEFDYDIPLKSPDRYRVQFTDQSGIPQRRPDTYARIFFDGKREMPPNSIKCLLDQYMNCASQSINCVSVDKTFHGPAVTMHILVHNFHDISVDMSPSLLTNQVTLRDYRWPRDQTTYVLPQQVIQEIEKVGLHLVPKGENLWNISVSRAERELMSRIDHDNGCRKMCHKLLKSDFDEWSKHYNLDGISTVLFKHELFSLNEEQPWLNWARSQLYERYCDMLQDLSRRLHRRRISNYFRPTENLLEGKYISVLNKLAILAMNKRKEIIDMESRATYKRRRPVPSRYDQWANLYRM